MVPLGALSASMVPASACVTLLIIVITSGGIEEWVAEDKHHFCIR